MEDSAPTPPFLEDAAALAASGDDYNDNNNDDDKKHEPDLPRPTLHLPDE